MFFRLLVFNLVLFFTILNPPFSQKSTVSLPTTGGPFQAARSARITPLFSDVTPDDAHAGFHALLRDYKRSVYQEQAKLQALTRKYDRDEAIPVAVYVPGVLELDVVQQPASNGLYVSEDPGAVTQFRLAQQRGSTGLLAHNYLAGQLFFELEDGDEVYVINGDGSYRKFVVYDIADFQALTVYDYRDLETQAVLDQYQVVDRIYAADGDRLVFQTCIEKNGALAWGRRFILARLVDEAGPVD